MCGCSNNINVTQSKSLITNRTLPTPVPVPNKEVHVSNKKVPVPNKEVHVSNKKVPVPNKRSTWYLIRQYQGIKHRH